MQPSLSAVEIQFQVRLGQLFCFGHRKNHMSRADFSTRSLSSRELSIQLCRSGVSLFYSHRLSLAGPQLQSVEWFKVFPRMKKMAWKLVNNLLDNQLHILQLVPLQAKTAHRTQQTINQYYLSFPSIYQPSDLVYNFFPYAQSVSNSPTQQRGYYTLAHSPC